MKDSEILLTALITAIVVLIVGLLGINVYAALATEADTSSYIWNWNTPLFLLLMVVLGLLIVCIKMLISIYRLSGRLKNELN
ncbi:MAG TPA: hypothetical protein PKO16_00755 [Bacteroidia bacterium]|nr:hypothetical protein [Bacteroidia bacterium]